MDWINSNITPQIILSALPPVAHQSWVDTINPLNPEPGISIITTWSSSEWAWHTSWWWCTWPGYSSARWICQPLLIILQDEPEKGAGENYSFNRVKDSFGGSMRLGHPERPRKLLIPIWFNCSEKMTNYKYLNANNWKVWKCDTPSSTVIK